MKKFLSIALALVLTLALSVTCFAEVIKIDNNEVDKATKTVTAKYVGPSYSTDVYGVDVEFGAMEFTYTAAQQGTWDPDTHSYTGAAAATWTADGNTVEVTNHSNVDITVTVAYANAQGVTGVTGTVTNGTFDLAAGVVDAYDDAATGTATLTLAGEIAAANDAIGTVTVSIAKKAS